MKHFSTANRAWLYNLTHVMSDGELQSPRGMQTYEIIDHTCSFDMNFPICFHQNRRLSYKFMAAEAWWIISGSMFAEDIVPYNKHIEKFSDDGVIFNGNYGVPFVHQLNYVVSTLIGDKTSRQAVMTIWRPNPIQTKDYPCTISLMFMIRDGALHTKVTMRSQDLWLGQPYDFFNFSMMSVTVLNYYNTVVRKLAHEVKQNYVPVLLGNLYWSAFSTHIYEPNFQDVSNMIGIKPTKQGSQIPFDCISDLVVLKNSLLHCRDSIVKKEGIWQIRP